MSAALPVYVASDVHYGATRPEHAQAFLAWLDYAASRASWILLNGDVFDFWFEYQWGIPKGYDALLAALKSVAASGPPVTLMGGNHDWWGGRYLREEIGVEFLQDPVTRDVAGLKTFIAHGDGLGSGDLGYRVMKVGLRSIVTRTAFGLLPIPVGDRIARGVSHTEERWDQWGARQIARSDALREWAVGKLRAEPELDLVLLGHTHLPILEEVGEKRWYVNSGDWVFHKSYVILREGAAPEPREWGDE